MRFIGTWLISSIVLSKFGISMPYLSTLHAVNVPFLSDIGTNQTRIEGIISVVLEFLEQVLLAVEVAAEHR